MLRCCVHVAVRANRRTCTWASLPACNMATMKAVVFTPGIGLALKDIARPTPGPGEALVRVRRVGVCSTDLEITRGYAGYQGVLGHEFIGELAQVPDGSKLSVGDRVVGEINVTCGHCKNCQIGGVPKRNHCLDRTVVGIIGKQGTFAEYITLPVENLHKVPDNVDDQTAAFAEPLAAAFRIVEQGVIKETDKVAIIGDGKLGMMIAEAINSIKCDSIVFFGKHQEKLTLAPKTVKPEKVTEKTVLEHRDQFDVTIEATGNPSGIMLAAEITRPLGTMVLKTTCTGDYRGFNTAPLVVKELTIVGSRCGNFPMALDLLSSGKVDMQKYISKVYLLKEAVAAIAHATMRGTLKIQICMVDN